MKISLEKEVEVEINSSQSKEFDKEFLNLWSQKNTKGGYYKLLSCFRNLLESIYKQNKDKKISFTTLGEVIEETIKDTNGNGVKIPARVISTFFKKEFGYEAPKKESALTKNTKDSKNINVAESSESISVDSSATNSSEVSNLEFKSEAPQYKVDIWDNINNR